MHTQLRHCSCRRVSQSLPANLRAATWRTSEPQLVQPILGIASFPLAQVPIQTA